MTLKKSTFTFCLIFLYLLTIQPTSVEANLAGDAYTYLSGLWNDMRAGRGDDQGTRGEGVSRSKRQYVMGAAIGDESPLAWEVRSSGLPTMPGDGTKINSRYMPTLSNGHIGVTVSSDALYMNGLYEGAGEKSHRARIPNLLMGRVNFDNENIERLATRKFSLNARQGIYTETIDSQYAYIEHRMYAHQKYIRVFVSEIYAKQKPIDTGSSGIVININYPAGLNSSEDIRFDTPRDHNANKQVKGTTLTSEAGTSPQTFFVFYIQPVFQIPLISSNTEMNVTMIMSVDRVEANARSEFENVLSILGSTNPQRLRQDHIDAWSKIWDTGRVEVYGETALAKLTWFSQYYLLSSLPAPAPALPPQYSHIYYGSGRTSLAKGGVGKDYQGHVMWDNELYILPAVLPFQPNTAKKLLRYRSYLADAALQNAKRYGSEGYHYPSESAFSGGEVAPNTCAGADGPSGRAGTSGPAANVTTGDCNWRKQYVTALVNWAGRQYWCATRDRDYMVNPEYNGCDVARETARFLASRLVYDNSLARYNMYNVTGPDEWHPNVHNHAFSVAASSLAIHWARYFICLCPGRNELDEVPDEWVLKALYAQLPYDNVKRLHYEYEGFTGDEQVKQADTIMLGYPLNWNVSDDIKRNDLEYYERLTSPSTPAMTWSWFTIGFKFVNEINKMNAYFLKSYQDYLVQPFKIWTEHTESSASDQAVGNVNFLPGMGGFLQSLVYGYAGVRIRPEAVEFHNPFPPQGASKLVLNGFRYLQNVLTITIEKDKITVFVNSTNQEYPLILHRNTSSAAEESLTAGSTIIINDPASGFFIYSGRQDTCHHPFDYIHMPWGYSPWVNSAPSRFKTAGLNSLTHTAALLTTVYTFYCSMERLTLLTL